MTLDIHSRDLTSTNGSTLHYLAQRITAVMLVPLSLWFIFSTISLIGVSYVDYVAWLGSISTTCFLVLFLIALFFHIQLGLQVVIEDYVHYVRAKVFLLLMNKVVTILFALVGIISIVKLSFEG